MGGMTRLIIVSLLHPVPPIKLKEVEAAGGVLNTKGELLSPVKLWLVVPFVYDKLQGWVPLSIAEKFKESSAQTIVPPLRLRPGRVPTVTEEDGGLVPLHTKLFRLFTVQVKEAAGVSVLVQGVVKAVTARLPEPEA